MKAWGPRGLVTCRKMLVGLDPKGKLIVAEMGPKFCVSQKKVRALPREKNHFQNILLSPL